VTIATDADRTQANAFAAAMSSALGIGVGGADDLPRALPAGVELEGPALAELRRLAYAVIALIAAEPRDTEHRLEFEPGWLAYGGGWATDAVTIDRGRVYLRGLIGFPGVGMDPLIAVLPPGYRPVSGTEQFQVRCGDGSLAYVYVQADGQLGFGGTEPQANSNFTLSGINFDTRG
jgi:hypothetical protein